MSIDLIGVCCRKTIKMIITTIPALNDVAQHGIGLGLSIASSHETGPMTEEADEEKRKSDFPEVKFYYRSLWDNAKSDKGTSNFKQHDKAKCRNDFPRKDRYLEDIHGTTISTNRLRAMFTTARELFHHYAVQGVAPKTWGTKTADVASHFRMRMYQMYPELSYCSSHWKVAEFGTHQYSQFASGETNKELISAGKLAIKTEPGASAELTVTNTTKRPFVEEKASKPSSDKVKKQRRGSNASLLQVCVHSAIRKRR